MHKNKKGSFGQFLGGEKVGGGYILSGAPLDGVKLDFFTEKMFYDIKSIVCYNYEDGKYWHDNTCVMELIFYNSYDEFNGDGMRLRLLYCHLSELLYDLWLLHECTCNHLSFIKMDIHGFCSRDSAEEGGVCLKDFDKFECEIVHKKHFHPDNEEMPDD